MALLLSELWNLISRKKNNAFIKNASISYVGDVYKVRSWRIQKGSIS